MRFRPFHWAARFASSLWPGRPPASEVSWAGSWLSDAEATLFARMSAPDQRHALAVARHVEGHLAEVEPDRRTEVMAAALLHDVGKTAAGLGTYGRAVATLCGLVAHDMAEVWQSRDGFTRRVGLYLRYGEVGADMLRVAGSTDWVVAWSIEHHLPPESWSLPVAVGEILVAGDR